MLIVIEKNFNAFIVCCLGNPQTFQSRHALTSQYIPGFLKPLSYGRWYVCVCVHVCTHTYVRMCMHVSVHVCVSASPPLRI